MCGINHAKTNATFAGTEVVKQKSRHMKSESTAGKAFLRLREKDVSDRLSKITLNLTGTKIDTIAGGEQMTTEFISFGQSLHGLHVERICRPIEQNPAQSSPVRE